ncbi:hypothetical protein BU24DRAFT_126481 [Aaosphaeria arxii CBS 175.79]|uniref:Uncharacterized protein n=1 Tax=Aaosphaeria arxii CBS 175.79 TaxID=1450172 RepID=A0A6A5Y2J1_9PLEO|nr:uncharacterized protein BU24DRAFT_126481 [Aaosphaeria arxii CBS 175.79]KAF2019752.1 hypothetical protein BU24DRAFT_126481 [Aaosphaeria arxii CBS 175.79]
MWNKSHIYFIFSSLALLSNALPFENAPNNRLVVPPARSYSIVNVDGGSTTPTQPEPTTVVETVQVTSAAPTTTTTVTTTTIQPAPILSPVSTSTISTSSTPTTITSQSTTLASSTTTPTTTPAPHVITVTVTDTAGPTEYYDNGLWHTYYPVKTFATVAVVSAASS